MKKNYKNTYTPAISNLIKLERKNNFGNFISPQAKYWIKTLSKLVLQMLFIIWAIFTIVFCLVEAIPGDPKIVTDLMASKADEATINATRDLFNLNDPFIVRYFKALGSLFDGTMGFSGSYGVSVSSILWEKIALSFQIGFFAISISIMIGIPLGVALARRTSKTSDVIAAIIAVLAFSIPAFVMAIIFLYISFLMGLPIIFEFNNWYMILLPAFVISIPVGFTYSRYLRSSIREEYEKQYVALARIKGLSESKVLTSHVIKPSLYPIATYFPIIVSAALFGSITVETVFAIPGAGNLLLTSALEKDQAMLLGISVVYTSMVVISFFVRDLLIQFIDPRSSRVK